ncbi:MAG: hypothetical protein HQ592_08335 [Planctomycetes bacterium]|nr:hypothetical protein [Planctomycetota bacterium]
MRCSKCGLVDPVAREYCTNCGSKIDLSSTEHLVALMDQKREERERVVFSKLSRLLAGSVILLIILFGLKAAFRWIPHEPVEAYVPPPHVSILHSRKLTIQTPMLPAPDAKNRGYTTGKEENQTVKALLSRALDKAPKFRMGGADGEVIRGFVIKRHGDAITIFTDKGPRNFAAKNVTQLD